MYAAGLLHVHCSMHVAYTLRVCCICGAWVHVACVLHVCGMYAHAYSVHAACVLHVCARCMHTACSVQRAACVLNVPYMYDACVLRVGCVYVAFMLHPDSIVQR